MPRASLANPPIHEHNYRPALRFLGKVTVPENRRITARSAQVGLNKFRRPQMYFGFEVEVERTDGHNHPDCTDAARELVEAGGGLFYCKHDGSLSNGFEIVSQPFTWDWLRKPINAKKFAAIFNLRHQGYRSYQTTTCGFHVHMTRRALGPLGCYKLLEFAYRWPAFWLRLSARRNMARMSRWANPRPTEHVYGGPALKRTTKAKGTSPNRYSAVNITTETVEIRIFRGTLAKGGFFRTLETVRALELFARLAPLSDLTPSRFFGIVAEYRKELPHLVAAFPNDVKPYLPTVKVRPEAN